MSDGNKIVFGRPCNVNDHVSAISYRVCPDILWVKTESDWADPSHLGSEDGDYVRGAGGVEP